MSTTREPAREPEHLWLRIGRAVLLTALRGAGHLAALVVFFLVAISLTQQCEFLFARYELALPDITLGVVTFSNRLAKFWYLLCLALVFVDAPMLFTLEMLPRPYRWLARVWFSGVLLLALLAVGYIALALSAALKLLGELDA